MPAAREDWSWVESPNKYTGRKKAWPVSAVIVHYTASSSALGTVNYFSKKEVKWKETDPKTGKKVTKSAKVSASAHLVISREGHVTQMVDFNDRAWHAGDGILWDGEKKSTNINNFTVGIELANWGKLEKKGDEFFVWRPLRPGHAKYTTPYTGPTPKAARDGYWEPYPAAQIEALISALRTIVETYPSVTRDRIVGHEDVSPHRKTDPGGAFPWDVVLDTVFPPSEPEPATEPSPEPSPQPSEEAVCEVPDEPADEMTYESAVSVDPVERKGTDGFWVDLIEWFMSLFRR